MYTVSKRVLISLLGIILLLLDIIYFNTLCLEFPVFVLLVLVLLIHSIHFKKIKSSKTLKFIYFFSLLAATFCFILYWSIMLFGASFEGRKEDLFYLFILMVYAITLNIFNVLDYK